MRDVGDKAELLAGLGGIAEALPDLSQSRAGVSAIGVLLPAIEFTRFARSRMLVSTPDARL